MSGGFSSGGEKHGEQIEQLIEGFDVDALAREETAAVAATAPAVAATAAAEGEQPPAAAHDEPGVYRHVCIKCGGEGVNHCKLCDGAGVVFHAMGMLKRKCPLCKGRESPRCAPCGGVGKFKVFCLPAVLKKITVSHTAGYYQAVSQRLMSAPNVIFDSVNYHQMKTRQVSDNNAVMEIDGVSTIDITPGGLQLEGFSTRDSGGTAAQFVQSRLKIMAKNEENYVRYIGRFLNVEVDISGLGCRFALQCYYLELLNKNQI